MFILKRYLKFYESNGLIKTILKIILTPIRVINKKIYNTKKVKIFEQNSAKKKFELIYKTNFWSSKESVSGLGSEYKNTINIRKELTNLIKEYNIESILDAPCGDFNWIQSILNKNLKYIGGDIVKKLIDKNNNIYKDENINFISLDITTDKLPQVDLMICRDCLYHFSYEDIFKFFENFINSNIRLLLTTSHYFSDKFFFKNKNILTGDYREIDLFSEPFNFKKNYLLSIEDKVESHFLENKFLYLFSRKQISEFVKIKTSGHK